MFGPNCLGYRRVSTIGTDDNLRALDDGAVILRAALYADHTSILDQDLLDGEIFADLRGSSDNGAPLDPWMLRCTCQSSRRPDRCKL